jgi:hypothetical protein
MSTVLEMIPHTQEKPHPNSYDSAQENSLDHWLEVYWLVEEDYVFAKDADSEPQVDEPTVREALV